MAWFYLLLAGVFEIGFAIGLKYTEGFTRLWPSVATAAAAAVSLWLLTQPLRTIPVGTAYAIWTGIGAVGVATVGILVLIRVVSVWVTMGHYVYISVFRTYYKTNKHTYV